MNNSSNRPPHQQRTRRPANPRMRAMTVASPAASTTTKQSDLFRVSGLPAVQALFARDPGRVEKLFFEERMRSHVGNFTRIMANARKLYREVNAAELERINGSVLHGGIVALTHPKTPVPFDFEQARRLAVARKPLLLLDGVGNPHNLGAIARTCAFFGLEDLVISDHPGQASPSEAAWRVAEGGLESITLYRAVRFAATLKRLKPFYHVVGTALTPNAKTLGELKPDNRPLAIVLGNEEEGLPTATLEACESVIKIAGSGRVQSLNVSATAAILVHDLMSSGKCK